MRVRVLGAAAGGGSPQWNCNCRVCQAARAGGAQPRTQSSIVVRHGGEPWVLINASPDLRQQLEALPFERGDALRANPIGAIVFTDAEIDHTAGLLLLRESRSPLEVYATDAVRAALTDFYPVFRMLERYSGLTWHELKPGETTPVAGTSIALDPFVTGGDAPLYMGDAPGPEAIGLTIHGPSGTSAVYAPALPELTPALLERLGAGELLLADGTFWVQDELVALGLSTRDSWAMGHAPLTGDGGTLDALAALPTRTVLIHINNSNPILLDASPERAALEERGVTVAYDGLEVQL
jgi:pyrroloquinoline quinone biosynthesis protein B